VSQTATMSQDKRQQSRAIERRAWVRIPCNKEASCQSILSAAEILWPGKILNVSAGGMGLRLTRRFEPGTLLEVGMRGVARPYLMQVLHVSAHSPGVWYIGGAFPEPLTDEELSTLLKSEVIEDKN